ACKLRGLARPRSDGPGRRVTLFWLPHTERKSPRSSSGSYQVGTPARIPSRRAGVSWSEHHIARGLGARLQPCSRFDALLRRTHACGGCTAVLYSAQEVAFLPATERPCPTL